MPAVSWEGPVEENDVEDFAAAAIRFENGSWMSLEANWLMHPTPRPWGIEYLANDGRATLMPLKIEVARGREVADETPAFEENPTPVRSFLAEAVRCARDGTDPIVRPHEIVQTQAVMDAVYESARTGAEVPVRLE